MKKHIIFLHVWKAIDHTVLLTLSYFWIFFFCRLMNIFLTQFWTVKLLIHKPQPRLNASFSSVISYYLPFLFFWSHWSQETHTFIQFIIRSLDFQSFLIFGLNLI